MEEQANAKEAKKAKLEALKKKEEERIRLQKLKEEQLAKRREETKARAAEALLKAKEAAEKEKKAKEEERRMRKENRTGGGFKLQPKKKWGIIKIDAKGGSPRAFKAPDYFLKSDDWSTSNLYCDLITKKEK